MSCAGAWVLNEDSVNYLRIGFTTNGTPENTSTWTAARLLLNNTDGDTLILNVTAWDDEYSAGNYGRVVFTVTAANVETIRAAAPDDIVLGIVQQEVSTGVWKTWHRIEIPVRTAKAP
jgi:hypothetical protein